MIHWGEISEIQMNLSLSVKDFDRNVCFTERWLIKYLLIETR